MTWAAGRTTLDELKSLPGSKGVGTIVFGAVCLCAWTVITLYTELQISEHSREALLWTGEVLFFWGCAQYVYWNVRRIYRQTRTGDRRLPKAGRRATDAVVAEAPLDEGGAAA